MWLMTKFKTISIVFTTVKTDKKNLSRFNKFVSTQQIQWLRKNSTCTLVMKKNYMYVKIFDNDVFESLLLVISFQKD